MGGLQMKDVIDMVTDVRALINVPTITSLIDGKVHPNFRPDGSEKADIVVNGIDVLNTQDQVGGGNINVYVPKIKDVNGVMVPDQTRLNLLLKKASALVDNQFRPTFRVKVDGPAKIKRDTDGSYYGNIRYKYYSLQSDFKQI